ncbi:MAG: hypothetical protein ACTHOF_05025 [Flavisolibacter sp.]|jgi:hypothetical protein
MKSGERHSQNVTGLRALPASQRPVEYQHVSIKHNHFATETNLLQMKETTAKISRRYSFDDNGGGYLGL